MSSSQATSFRLAILLFSALVEGGGRLAPPVPDPRAANIPHLARGTGRKAIVESPMNYAVYAGETVTFRCSVAQAPPSSRVKWAELISSQGGSVISDNENKLAHPNRDRYYIVHNTSTEFHLQITDVRLEDGGQYVCQDVMAGPPDVFRGFASLIVIASPPNCTNTSPPHGNVIEGQEFTIECSTRYQGTYPPTMHWSGPDPFDVYFVPPSPTTVWGGIRYTVHRGMDTNFYKCLTNFTDLGELPNDTARNPPSWEYLYRAPQIFVSWGPMNLMATPIKTEYEVGDLITCAADAKPSASYQWVNLRSLATYNSNTYPITEDMRGYNDQLRCLAQNIIQGNVYQANLFFLAYVPPSPSTASPSTVSLSTASPSTASSSRASPSTANPSTVNPSTATATGESSAETTQLTTTSPQATDLTSRTTTATKAPQPATSNFLFALAIFVFFFVLISFMILSVCFVILLRRQREAMNGVATKQFDIVAKK